MVPNIIHLIFGLRADFGGKPFSFFHYLTVKTAHETNKPITIKFHYKYEPQGEWWEKAKPYLTLVPVEPPTEIFGNPLMHIAHQADVLRLEILIREGGIYLDMDILCLNSFSPLRIYDCAMGMEEDFGLCNAVIIAKPNAEFLKIWYQSYKNFRSKGKDEFWVEHSIKMPLKLSKEYPLLVHIEDKYSFFWPNHVSSPITVLWDRPAKNFFDALLLKFKKAFSLRFIRTSYCIHLWEQLWWDNYLSAVTVDRIRNSSDNFSKLCRMILYENISPVGGKFTNYRSIMKNLIKWHLKD